MKVKIKLTKLLGLLLAIVMAAGMMPSTTLAEETDVALRFADAPGVFFYNNSGGFNSEGPTVDTLFTLTEPTKITGIWTYHYNVDNYDVDFSRQTIALQDAATGTVLYSGAVRVGHYWNPNRDCDWIVLPDIVLPVGTYRVIDSHQESWCAQYSKGGWSNNQRNCKHDCNGNMGGDSCGPDQIRHYSSSRSKRNDYS